MKNAIANLEARSMQNNLIFDIPDIPESKDENTENIVLDFIENKMLIDKNEVRIEVAHRYGPHIRGQHRSIVCKFESRKDKDKVRRNGKHLKGTDYQVREQYPKVINDRRRKLYPYMKKARSLGQKAFLNKDVLRVDGRSYTVDTIGKCHIKLDDEGIPEAETMETGGAQV